jgi:thioredoxin 1
MSGEIIQLTDDSFDAAVQASPPILVDFWAAWCGPCKMIAPSLEALAVEYAGRIRIGKLNVDENGATASRYGVQSIPTLMLFADGKIADKMIGAAPKDAISQLLDKHL